MGLPGRAGVMPRPPGPAPGPCPTRLLRNSESAVTTVHHPTRWPFTLVALSMLSVVLAACVGGDGSAAGPSGPPSGVVSSGSMPPPPSGPSEPQPNMIAPQPAVQLRPQRWTRAEPERGGSQVLV